MQIFDKYMENDSSAAFMNLVQVRFQRKAGKQSGFNEQRPN